MSAINVYGVAKLPLQSPFILNNHTPVRESKQHDTKAHSFRDRSDQQTLT